ncbi:acyltransferase [Photobacterium sanguinicancri]|uniref:Acetyltransferase n=1 Tax=Photobacterium sanguinicancri TaxID=875932 RepID=A0ABX4G047_9GAMM|nr:acyltransferase [Photobacterium sanguinicancri]OZS44421.1 acetyltransferase [Photobacterium sanguinicancri]
MRTIVKNMLEPTQIAMIKIYLKAWRNVVFPVIPFVHNIIYQLHVAIKNSLHCIIQKLYYTPLFLSQISSPPKQLQLYSGMPLLLGTVNIQMGNHCVISGVSTITGRVWGKKKPQLLIGNNVEIGWQNTLAVGSTIQLDDNVRLAGKVFLAGYPGHPINPMDRAADQPDLPQQVGDIHLCRNVWLGTGVIVIAGVTIGENSIIAAGSVVTKNIPANVLVGGNPACVIKQLEY